MGFNTASLAIPGIWNGKAKGPLAVLLVGILAFTAFLDVLQLLCMLVGAFVYAVFAVPVVKVRAKEQAVKIESNVKPSIHIPAPSRPTIAAIKAPTFTTSHFDRQVEELVERIMPTPSCHRAVETLTAMIREKIQTLVPEAEVMGFATGELRGGTAYGVAVPEVDIVANACPRDLTKGLQERLVHGSRHRTVAISKLDTRKLQKSGIRVCTSLLVSLGLKFRRSSFRSGEPKVTLLAPASLGASDVAIPIDFSINNSTPLYNMALLTECGQIDPRAKSLILLVKRWAKDRGVCHASKGHLPPYAWSLLTIYFLQTGIDEPDGGLPLPALDGFALSSGLMTPQGQSPSTSKTTSRHAPEKLAPSPQTKTMGDLFRGFMRFYNQEFDWRKEAVSVRCGKRAPPDLSLDIHIVLSDDGTTAVSPIVEDPFDLKRNLGNCTNAASLERFLEEIDRADTLLTQGTSLTKLLEPWRPPEYCCEEDHENAEHCEEYDD